MKGPELLCQLVVGLHCSKNPPRRKQKSPGQGSRKEAEWRSFAKPWNPGGWSRYADGAHHLSRCGENGPYLYYGNQHWQP